MPDDAMARAFRDHAGRLNQAVAGAAGRVYFVAAGLPVGLKGAGEYLPQRPCTRPGFYAGSHPRCAWAGRSRALR